MERLPVTLVAVTAVLSEIDSWIVLYQNISSMSIPRISMYPRVNCIFLHQHFSLLE